MARDAAEDGGHVLVEDGVALRAQRRVRLLHQLQGLLEAAARVLQRLRVHGRAELEVAQLAVGVRLVHEEARRLDEAVAEERDQDEQAHRVDEAARERLVDEFEAATTQN